MTSGSNRRGPDVVGRSAAYRLRWPHSKLERRLVSAVLAVVLVTMVLLGIIDYRSIRRSAIEELSARGEQVVTRLEHSLANPLWSYDEQAASAYLLGEMQDDDIVAIVVTDEEDESLWIAYGRENTEHGPNRLESEGVLEDVISAGISRHTGTISYDSVEIGSVIVFFRDDAVREQVTRRLVSTAIVATLFGVIVSLLIVLLLHRMVVSPLQSLLTRLDRVSVGDYDVRVESHRNDDIGVITAGFDRMVATIAEREASLRASAEEKEAMLREIHHRVKNNFQILSSLLNLQKRGVPHEAVSVLEDSEHRVRSMEMVHEKLYESPSLAHIRVSSYIRELVELLRVSYGIDSSRFHVETDAADLPLDIAIPLGLIINEAVSNACKHACSYSDEAEVHVEFTVRDGHSTLIVQDTGPGFPEPAERTNHTGLGLQLITALADQIHGTAELGARRGDQSHKAQVHDEQVHEEEFEGARNRRPRPRGARVAVRFPLASDSQSAPSPP